MCYFYMVSRTCVFNSYEDTRKKSYSWKKKSLNIIESYKIKLHINMKKAIYKAHININKKEYKE